MAKIDEWLEKDKLTLLEAWARDGLTYEQISHNMGIDVTTLREWRKKDSTISAALKKGKEVVDIEVENALYKNAIGFYFIEQVISTKKEVVYENGKKIKEISEPVAIDIKRYKQPETTAQIFWLKNRKPKFWRDRVEVEANKEELSKLDELLGEIKKDANK